MISKDENNMLLNRREVSCIFKDMGGKLTRRDAAEMVKEKLNIDKLVIPIRLSCEHGKRDVKGLFYIYDDETVAKKYLSEYVFKRMEVKKEEGGES